MGQCRNPEQVATFGRATYWQRSYISKILTSPAVVGTFVPHLLKRENGKRTRKPLAALDSYYPAVVDKQTFTRVQSLLRSHAALRGRQDRKSTRLNSSHRTISYAVFCLKK